MLDLYVANMYVCTWLNDPNLVAHHRDTPLVALKK